VNAFWMLFSLFFLSLFVPQIDSIKERREDDSLRWPAQNEGTPSSDLADPGQIARFAR